MIDPTPVAASCGSRRASRPFRTEDRRRFDPHPRQDRRSSVDPWRRANQLLSPFSAEEREIPAIVTAGGE